uniref:Doublecortin domain-containing protein n=1 Tax=Globodera rostochiensis TaxID=31243 RepID=A0A914IFV0_GLORO
MRGANAVGSSHVRLTPEGSRRIRVYRNGDAHFKGITIVLNTRQVHNIDALLDMISEKIGLVMGCKRLFTLDGTPMKSMEQLQHNMEYVAASGAFIPVRYGRVGSASGSMLTRSSSNFSAASREDPLAQSGASKQSAPASLTSGAHAPLRPSRSIEPRRMPGRPPPSAPMNGPTSRKKAEERSKKGGDSKKERDGSKKRKASKKKGEVNDELLLDDPPAPVEAAVPEAHEEQQNENHQLQSQPEEEEAEDKAETDEEQPPARRRTEVEVVEHHEEEEEEDGEQEQQQQEAGEGRVATPGSSRSPRAPTAETEDDEEEAEQTPQTEEGEGKREGGQ